MAFFEGCPVGWGGTHWSWPGGRGGRPRALVAGEGWGGRSWLGGRTCVVFLLFLTRTKRRKIAFFLKDALWGGGGTHRKNKGVRQGLAWRGKAGWVPTKLAWWTGGQGGGARARGGGARASVAG